MASDPVMDEMEDFTKPLYHPNPTDPCHPNHAGTDKRGRSREGSMNIRETSALSEEFSLTNDNKHHRDHKHNIDSGLVWQPMRGLIDQLFELDPKSRPTATDCVTFLQQLRMVIRSQTRRGDRDMGEREHSRTTRSSRSSSSISRTSLGTVGVETNRDGANPNSFVSNSNINITGFSRDSTMAESNPIQHLNNNLNHVGSQLNQSSLPERERGSLSQPSSFNTSLLNGVPFLSSVAGEMSPPYNE